MTNELFVPKDENTKTACSSVVSNFLYPDIEPSINCYVVNAQTNIVYLFFLCFDLMTFKNFELITLVCGLEFSDKALLVAEALCAFFPRIHLYTLFTTVQRKKQTIDLSTNLVSEISSEDFPIVRIRVSTKYLETDSSKIEFYQLKECSRKKYLLVIKKLYKNALMDHKKSFYQREQEHQGTRLFNDILNGNPKQKSLNVNDFESFDKFLKNAPLIYYERTVVQDKLRYDSYEYSDDYVNENDYDDNEQVNRNYFPKNETVNEKFRSDRGSNLYKTVSLSNMYKNHRSYKDKNFGEK